LLIAFRSDNGVRPRAYVPDMAALDDSALMWLRQHHATISTTALAASKVTLDQRAVLVQAGLLVRVVDGAYALGGVEPTELSRCTALSTSRPELVVAGPTAGRLWGLRRVPRDGLVHVIAPPGSHPCREPWVRPYRTALVDDEDVVVRDDGVRLTSPPRTVVDLTRYVHNLALISIIEHAISSEMCTRETLFRVAERLDTRGRPWVRRFLRVLGSRHPSAASESEGELRVLNALVERGVEGLTRQHPIALLGYGRARFDIAIPSIKWALEVDLHPEHRSSEGVARDNRRDAAAESLGWRVRRVGEVELDRGQFAGTMDDVAREVRRRAAEWAPEWDSGRCNEQ